MGKIRLVEVHRKVSADNDRVAAELRDEFRKRKLLAVNILSSPGAGKTLLLEKTAEVGAGKLSMAVIEGDVQTTRDAERLDRAGIETCQITTGGACHLKAYMVREAFEKLDLAGIDLLVIENVGNLVCPSGTDLGEMVRVVLLSTPEGDDKPQKYPRAFQTSHALMLTKCDLLGHVPFDPAHARADALAVNPNLTVLETSALSGAGMDAWIDYLLARRAELCGQA